MRHGRLKNLSSSLFSSVKGFIPILGWLLLSQPSPATADQVLGSGTTGLNFQKIEMGARGVALGESFISVADDATAIYWNPAGLAVARGTQLSLTHAQWLVGSSHEVLAFSRSDEGRAGLGASIDYWNSGAIDGSLETAGGSYGGTSTSLNAYGYTASLAGAQRLSNLSSDDILNRSVLGMKVSFLGQSLATLSSFSLSFDAGLLYEAIPDTLTFGAVVHNIGGQILDFSQPFEVRVGASVRAKSLAMKEDYLILAADSNTQVDTGLKVDGGAEYKMIFDQDSLALRGGYRYGSDYGAVTGFTLGVGVGHQFQDMEMGLDYAFVPYGDLGDTHRITLNVIFGGNLIPPSAALRNNEAFTLGGDPLNIGISAKSQLPVKNWTVSLAGPSGVVVKKFSGTGNPPGFLAWDGRDETGKSVPQGSYTITMGYTDTKGQRAQSEPSSIYAFSGQFSGDLLFDSGKAELKEEGNSVIKETVDTLQKRCAGCKIIVEGYTDSVKPAMGGKFKSNQALSKARAQAVVDYLVKSGVDAQRLKAVGYGDTHPVDSNETQEGRAKNRRVVLSLAPMDKNL